MLGDDAWRRLFHADPQVIGRAVVLDGFSYTIIGVLPPSFELDLPTRPRNVDLWKVPDSWWQNGNMWASEGLSAGKLQFIGRLTATANEAEAIQQVARFAESERRRQTALAAAGLDLAIAPLQADVVREAKPILIILSGGVVCVLLIACANVMNLLLVRAYSRRRELAVRLALGSSRTHLIRLMMVESVVLASAGGVGGGAAAVYGGPVPRGASSRKPAASRRDRRRCRRACFCDGDRSCLPVRLRSAASASRDPDGCGG